MGRRPLTPALRRVYQLFEHRGGVDPAELVTYRLPTFP